ncbi:MAG: endonuclease/exonuclease/phosphatase family protein [Phycisphaerales bacterium]|nr:endonuclease/exonuclease/phosphatase family protein [Phycisphaerales bacterium]
MKLLAWNILHGGGARRMPQIALSLLEHDADIVVLTEYRRTVGGQIRAVLDDHGWRHQVSTEPAQGVNGILIASRWPLEFRPFEAAEASGRLLQAVLPQADTTIIAAHVPDRSAPRARTGCWRALLNLARACRAGDAIVLGDFNTGRHQLDESGATFNCTALLGELSAMGYADAWRLMNPDGREFSWRSSIGNGFRIDAAFVSPSLRPRVRAASYSHAERENRVSDHSALLLSLAAH